jgi:5-(carboxyamino)imidazole ribonucleotide synthase
MAAAPSGVPAPAPAPPPRAATTASSQDVPLMPGATLGILGGGQLGRMLAMEARRMGYRVAVMDPDPTCPARSWCDHFELGAFGDAAAAARLAAASDVVTVETEHIPADVLEGVARIRAVHPRPDVLRHIQDRLAQRRFLTAHGLPQPRWADVHDEASARAAQQEVGTPAILKRRRGGYDGKGQARIPAGGSVLEAWESLGRDACVLESFIPFEREVSALLSRGPGGAVQHFDVAWNVHVGGILHTTTVPAPVPHGVVEQARAIASRVAAALDHRGVLCVELFLLADGTLLVNEVAPRVHNSGHFSLGACSSSQFEEHVRAVLGLPAGDTRLLSPATMLNVLGDAWAGGGPDWSCVLLEPRARLHLYGKAQARPGRKMAHVLVLDPDPQESLRVAQSLHASLLAGR